MSRQTEEVGPTVGLPRHRHFAGFFNKPVEAPTRGHPFYGLLLSYLFENASKKSKKKYPNSMATEKRINRV